MTNVNLNPSLDYVFCPICDQPVFETEDLDDWDSTYYYCCGVKPFYHMWKNSTAEEVFLCNEGKIILDTGDIFMTHKICTIVYKNKGREDSIVLTSIPEFDPKELPGFIKAAVNNVAFL